MDKEFKDAVDRRDWEAAFIRHSELSEKEDKTAVIYAATLIFSVLAIVVSVAAILICLHR